MSPFVLGSLVRWTSQASGVTAEKTGRIVAIVPAGAFPHSVAQEFGALYSTGPLRGFGMPRGQESYLVAVKQEDQKKARLYWPRVSQLFSVEEKEVA